MKLSRTLAVMLVLFGGLYWGLGTFDSVSRGPATGSFEAVRRFDAALETGRPALAATLGESAVRLAAADKRWQEADLADLEYRVAAAEEKAGLAAPALARIRSADAHLAQGALAPLQARLAIARLHGDLALEAGDGLEAACAYGVLLERLGPERIAHPELRIASDPALGALTQHLDDLAPSFASAKPENALPAAGRPLTSCALVSDFLVARKHFAAAAAVSRLIAAAVRETPALEPEIKSALLQQAAHAYELAGDVPGAKTELEEAIGLLAGAAHKPARIVALEAYAKLLADWSQSKAAMPLLSQSIALREQLYGAGDKGLVPPLLALGYAQLDGGDNAAAEQTLKRALAIAQGVLATDPSATLEATMALGELYDDEGRHEEAGAMRAQLAALEKTGAAMQPSDVENLPIAKPEVHAHLKLVDLPVESLGARTPSFERVSVALGAPKTANAIKKPGAGAVVPATDSFGAPFVASRGADSSADAFARANLFFIPGEGTSLDLDTARIAKLAALLGPAAGPALFQWTSNDDLLGLAGASRERAGARALGKLLSTLGARHDSQRIALIAEGRGAALLGTGFTHMPAGLRLALETRIGAVVLIAPDLGMEDLAAWLAPLAKAGTRITIYAAPTARALIARRDIFGVAPAGLDPAALAHIAGAQVIVLEPAGAATDFAALSSDAVLSDMAKAISGTAGTSRCDLVKEPKTDAQIFGFDPSGCPAESD